MSKEIKKYEAMPPDLKKRQEEEGEEFRVGDIFFDYRGENLLRISKIKQEKVWDNKADKQVNKWHVYYEQAQDWEGTEWHRYGSTEFEKFLQQVKEGELTKLTRPLSEVMDEARKVMSGEIDVAIYYESDVPEVNDNTALIHRSSKAGLIAIQKGLEVKKRSAELMHKAVKYEMEKKRQAMEVVRQKLYGAVEVFMKQVKKIMRVITTIELYLGIEEELHQIQEGVKADVSEPLCFRQMVLFIDEEVGAWEDGGLDFKNVKEFDQWLTTGDNIDIVLPEQKGVVVLRPRRYDKDYGDPYRNAYWNEANHAHTYILIRNGDCLYRIFTEKLTIQDRLFPRRNEMAKLAEQIEKATWDTEKEKIEDSLYQYKNRAMLLQGLVDRTDVFNPMPVDRLNLFKLHEQENLVRFIYDDEAALPSGRLSFHDWRKEMDEKIQHGSRVLITGIYESRRGYAERFYIGKGGYDGLKNVPDLPKEGVYEVEKFVSSSSRHYRETAYKKRLEELKASGEKFKDEGEVKGRVWTHSGDPVTGNRKVYSIRTFAKEEHLTIMYMPNAEASSGWNSWDTHERKLRTRFRIIPLEDDFVMNYDQVSLADVDFYIKSRVDRRDYLSMMPVLKKIRVHLQEEYKKEKDFARFITDRNESKLGLSRKFVEARVWEAIRWWKFKNQWKRAITKDDTLALRMIESRILSPNYSKLEKFEDD